MSSNPFRNARCQHPLWQRAALGFSFAGALAIVMSGCSSMRGPGSLSNKVASQANPAREVAANKFAETPARRSIGDGQSIAGESTYSTNRTTSASPVVPVSYQETVQCQTCNDPSCASSGSCGPIAGNASNCVNTDGETITDLQEYVFDGGDLGSSFTCAKRSQCSWPESNGHCRLLRKAYDGKLCVTPTNRVPIYAPRFGAIRQVTGIIQSEHAQGTERILAPISPSHFEDKNLASSVVKPEAPHGEESVSLIDAFRDANLGVPIAQVIPPQRMSDAIVPFEAIDFFRTGILKAEDIAVLGQFFQNAKTWETPESLEVLIDGQEAAIAKDIKQAQDVHVYEMPPGKCSLRICKAASHMIANSGDQISFTIRFDNIGIHPIEKVTVVDSLSPRLEYIEESQQCSVAPAPEFTSEPNDVGSTVLKWEFKAPLKPGEGGVLHFRCLVR